jgi:hypothetical protein
MDNTVIAVCAVAVNPASNIQLKEAEAELNRLLAESPSQVIYDLLAGSVNPDVPPPVQVMCAIRVKNFLKNTENLENCDMSLVKNALVQAVPSASDYVRRQLMESARIVHEFHEEWTDMLPMLIVQLSQSGRNASSAEDVNRVLSALLLVYVIVRTFKLEGAVAVEEHEDTATSLLPLLPQLASLQDLRVTHMVLKVFEALTARRTPRVLRSDVLFSGWMNFMLAFAAEQRPEYALGSPPYTMYLKCMKRVASISYHLVQLAARLGNKKVGAAKFFVANFAHHFTDMWIAWLRFLAPLPHEDRAAHVKVTANALRYLREAACVEASYPAIPVPELCTSLLFPFFPFNEEDEELWGSDFNEYLRRLAVNPGEDKTDVRFLATKLLQTLMAAKKPYQSRDHLLGVLQFVHGGLQQPASRDTDGFLYMLGVLKPCIKRVDAFSATMESVLVSCIAPLLSNTQPVLRAKALWICGLYGGVPFEDPNNFEAMLRAVLAALDDPDITVRTQVIGTMTCFLALRRSRPYLRECLDPLARECLRLVNDNNSDFAVDALQALVAVFGPELSKYLADICHSLVQRSKAARFDLQAAEQAAAPDGFEVDEDNEAEKLAERGAFAADKSLRALANCVEALAFETQTLLQLQPELCELVREILEEDDFDLAERALDVYDRVVCLCKDQLGPEVWAVFPLLHHAVMVTGSGIENFQVYLPIIDNMCTYCPESICEPDRLRMVYEMCEKMLHPDTAANAMPQALDAVAELLSCLFLQLRGVPHLFDQAAASSFLQLALRALSETDSTQMRARLCTAMWSAFIYSPEMALAVMDGTGATAFILGAYCDMATRPGALEKLYPTALGRKVHVLGVCAYLRQAISQGRPEAEAVASRLASVAAVCVRLNAPEYLKHTEALRRLVAGEGAKGDDDGYESNDSMDVPQDDEDQAAGSGAGGEEELDLDDMPGYNNDDDDGEEDDDDDIETSIDPICEVIAFREVMANCPASVTRAVAAVWPDIVAHLDGAAVASNELIHARVAYREAARVLHQQRAASNQ